MKLMKQLFSSLFIAGTMLSAQAIAEEKTAEQAQPQTQVQQQTAVQAPSQTVQQTVSDKLNINTASASDIQKALPAHDLPVEASADIGGHGSHTLHIHSLCCWSKRQ